jgi:hypothetical protein
MTWKDILIEWLRLILLIIVFSLIYAIYQLFNDTISHEFTVVEKRDKHYYAVDEEGSGIYFHSKNIRYDQKIRVGDKIIAILDEDNILDVKYVKLKYSQSD